MQKGTINPMEIEIDYGKMQEICGRSIASFSELMGDPYPANNGMNFFFRAAATPEGAKILAVAHLDSVHVAPDFNAISHMGEVLVFSPVLDDRLGAYVILDLLPKLGLDYDILLTEGEEVGKSTAAQFDIDKQYNWIFEFDRRGDDVVMYQYETPSMCALMRKFGFKVATGSFSDIGVLEHLGASAFNFGVGYHDEHSNFCFARMSEMVEQIAKFKALYDEYLYTPLPFKKEESTRYSYSRKSTGNVTGYYDGGKWIPFKKNNGWDSDNWKKHDYSTGKTDKTAPKEDVIYDENGEVLYDPDDAGTEEEYYHKYLDKEQAQALLPSGEKLPGFLEDEQLICEFCGESFEATAQTNDIFCLEDNACCAACYKKHNGVTYNPVAYT